MFAKLSIVSLALFLIATVHCGIINVHNSRSDGEGVDNIELPAGVDNKGNQPEISEITDFEVENVEELNRKKRASCWKTVGVTTGVGSGIGAAIGTGSAVAGVVMVGAAEGALIGSMFPIAGTVAGAVAGGALGAAMVAIKDGVC